MYSVLRNIFVVSTVDKAFVVYAIKFVKFKIISILNNDIVIYKI